MVDRRDILKIAGASAVAAALPRLVFAETPAKARLVLVILRGAVDGLALAAPYGDGNYRARRGELALDRPGSEHGVLKLDGMFGLHPSMPELYRDFERKDALIVHATASPYRQRSHFDGQDVLENGGAETGLLQDGWLNRALGPLNGASGSEIALAVMHNTPLVLRGSHAVTSWAPSKLPDVDDDTVQRLADLYAEHEFFAVRLAQALKARSIAADMDDMPELRGGARYMLTLMESTARFLKAEDGPRIAVLEAGGWDTHADQGGAAGTLATRFAALDTALAALRDGLGEAWQSTVVAVVTEFGRTVQVNGTRGTDHGTATAAVLLGGAVNGGRVVSDWPGLGKHDLFEDRDLKPTIDLRSVFKAILVDHLRLPSRAVERDVFPDSRSARALRDLISS